MDSIKKCSACQLEKPLNDFYKDCRRQGALVATCKTCFKFKNSMCRKAKNEKNKQLLILSGELEILPENYKRCTECKDVKTLKDFYKKYKNINTLTSKCKICLNSINAKTKRDKAQNNKKNKSDKPLIREKVCPSCDILKLVEFFNKSKFRPGGFSTYCKDCKKEKSKEYLSRSEVKLAKNEKSKIFRDFNREKINQATKIKRTTPEAMEKRRNYDSNRRKSDVQYKLKSNLRCRLYKAVSRVSVHKSDTTKELIGCSMVFLKDYLECLFLPTMTWENYGPVWHIDHIIPCSKFDLTAEENQRTCFHYTNLQPLFAITTVINGVEYIGNINKNNRIIQKCH